MISLLHLKIQTRSYLPQCAHAHEVARDVCREEGRRARQVAQQRCHVRHARDPLPEEQHHLKWWILKAIIVLELWWFTIQIRDYDSKSHFSMNCESLIQFYIESIHFCRLPSIQGCMIFAILNPISLFWIEFIRNSILKLNRINLIDWTHIDQFES